MTPYQLLNQELSWRSIGCASKVGACPNAPKKWKTNKPGEKFSGPFLYEHSVNGYRFMNFL